MGLMASLIAKVKPVLLVGQSLWIESSASGAGLHLVDDRGRARGPARGRWGRRLGAAGGRRALSAEGPGDQPQEEIHDQGEEEKTEHDGVIGARARGSSRLRRTAG